MPNRLAQTDADWRSAGAQRSAVCASAPVAPVPYRTGNWSGAADHAAFMTRAIAKKRRAISSASSASRSVKLLNAGGPSLAENPEVMRKAAQAASSQLPLRTHHVRRAHQGASAVRRARNEEVHVGCCMAAP